MPRLGPWTATSQLEPREEHPSSQLGPTWCWSASKVRALTGEWRRWPVQRGHGGALWADKLLWPREDRTVPSLEEEETHQHAGKNSNLCPTFSPALTEVGRPQWVWESFRSQIMHKETPGVLQQPSPGLGLKWRPEAHEGASADHQGPLLLTKTSREAVGHLSCSRPSTRTQARHCNNHNSSSQHLLSSEGLVGPSAKCITRIIPLNSHSNQHRNCLVVIPLGRRGA